MKKEVRKKCAYCGRYRSITKMHSLDVWGTNKEKYFCIDTQCLQSVLPRLSKPTK